MGGTICTCPMRKSRCCIRGVVQHRLGVFGWVSYPCSCPTHHVDPDHGTPGGIDLEP